MTFLVVSFHILISVALIHCGPVARVLKRSLLRSFEIVVEDAVSIGFVQLQVRILQLALVSFSHVSWLDASELLFSLSSVSTTLAILEASKVEI